MPRGKSGSTCRGGSGANASETESLSLEESSKIGDGRLVATADICEVGSLGLVDPFDFSFFAGFAAEAVLEADFFLEADDFFVIFSAGTSAALEVEGWGAEPSAWEVEEEAGSSIEEGVEAERAVFHRCNFKRCCLAFKAALVKA